MPFGERRLEDRDLVTERLIEGFCRYPGRATSKTLASAPTRVGSASIADGTPRGARKAGVEGHLSPSQVEPETPQAKSPGLPQRRQVLGRQARPIAMRLHPANGC